MRIRLVAILAEVFTFTAGVATGILLLRNFKADPSDWLSFAGSVIGASLAVIAALGAVSAQLSANENRQQSIMASLIKQLHDHANALLGIASGVTERTDPSVWQAPASRALTTLRATRQSASILRIESVQLAHVAITLDHANDVEEALATLAYAHWCDGESIQDTAFALRRVADKTNDQINGRL